MSSITFALPSNSGATLFASASSAQYTYANYPKNQDGTIAHRKTVTLSCDAVSSNPHIQFKPYREYKSDKTVKSITKFDNSVVLEVVWDGGKTNPSVYQEVAINGPYKGATWTYNDSALTKDSYVEVQSGDTVNVSVISASSSSGTNQQISDVIVAGYWKSGEGGIDGEDTEHKGTYSEPVDWPSNTQDANNYPVNLSWTEPVEQNKPLYQIVVTWKCTFGTEDGAKIGSISLINGGATTFVDMDKWWSDNPGNIVMYSIHPVYADYGICPSLLDASNVRDSKDNPPTYGVFRKFATAGQLVKVHFYDYNSGNPKLLYDTLGNEQSFSLPANKGNLDRVAPTFIRPDGKENWVLDGWYKGSGPQSADTSTIYAVGHLGKIASSELYVFAIYSPPTFTITYHSNYSPDSTEVRTYTPGESNSLAPSTLFSREDYIFQNWNTKANGSGESYEPGSTWEGITDTHLYATWISAWQKTISGIDFLHHERPKVKFQVKRESLQNPNQAVCAIYPTLCPLPDINGVDKNFVSHVRTIRYRPEIVNKLTWTYNYLYTFSDNRVANGIGDDWTAGLPVYDETISSGDHAGTYKEANEKLAHTTGLVETSKSYYTVLDDGIIDGSMAPKTGKLFLTNEEKFNNTTLKQGWTASNNNPVLLDIDHEYQMRLTIVDALLFRSAIDYQSEYAVRPGSEQQGMTNQGKYVELDNGVYKKGLNGNTLSNVRTINYDSSSRFVPFNFTESEWSNTALLLKYVTKLFVHNPFVDEVLKEKSSNRQASNPPETDYWQIREHTQKQKNTLEDLLTATESLLTLRGNENSVNGFDPTKLEDYIIPTLKRSLASNERLVYDYSQAEKLLAILNEINSEHVKTNREVEEFGLSTDTLKYNNQYSELEVGDFDSAKKYDQRILELDGERHHSKNAVQSMFTTESDSAENRVRDTKFKKVLLRNFEGKAQGWKIEDKETATSTIDHIWDYDISQIDLERSLSDLVYILSRMRPRAASADGSETEPTDVKNARRALKTAQEQAQSSADPETGEIPADQMQNVETKLSALRTIIDSYASVNIDEQTGNIISVTWKPETDSSSSSKFINTKDWIKSTSSWSKEENPITDYTVYDSPDLGEDYKLIRSGSEDEYSNNGCNAACMGLCTSGCYQTCVGGCNTSCGSNCFFGCNDTCLYNCGATCSTSCVGSCKEGCQDNCAKQCVGVCHTTCGRECLGTCGNACSGSCGQKCTTQCDTSCTEHCKGGCQKHCTNTCTQSCGSNCTGGCQNSCKESCSGFCNKNCGNACNQACSKGCGGGCSGACSKTCENNCETGCSGSCANGCNTDCSGSCGNNCDKSCSNTCGWECIGECHTTCDSTCMRYCKNSCIDNCTLGCKDGCHIKCDSGCSALCSGNCGNACSGNCSGACKNDCGSDCHTDCGGSCYDSCHDTCQAYCAFQCSSYCKMGCATACYGYCKDSCTGHCGGTCGTTCNFGCRINCDSICDKSCTLGCTGCRLDCSNQCADSCIDECHRACELGCTTGCDISCGRGCKIDCYRQCSTSCGSQCGTTCTESCRQICKSDCTGNCTYECTGGCSSECNGACMKTCNINCIRQCNDTCMSECDYNCGNGCGHNCGSVCSNSCTGNCNENCSSGCNNNCGKTCTGSCSGMCNGNCTGTCGYNCWSTCGSQCNETCVSGCKGGCLNGCNTTCGSSCSSNCGSACNNDCTQECTNSCINGCSSGCSTACSAQCESCGSSCGVQCNNSCEGGCEGLCDTGCEGSCKENCGASCGTTCFGSCSTQCIGFCYNTAKVTA